jgi:hypothetical protein
MSLFFSMWRGSSARGEGVQITPGVMTAVPVDTHTTDTTPAFVLGFPETVVAGWELVIQGSTNSFSSTTTYLSHTLTSDDIVDIEAETPLSFTGVTPLADGDWEFRARLENGATVGDWSDAEALVIDNAAPSAPVLSPADEATGVSTSTNEFTLTFSEPVELHSSILIELRNYFTDELIEAWDEDDIGFGTLAVMGDDTVTITRVDDLTEDQFYITVNAGGIRDYAGNQFAGIAAGAWQFSAEVVTYDPDVNFPEDGGWWDVAKSVADGTIYSDDGVTPVNSDGAVVYRIDDQSGNARHLKQATSTRRPLLKTDGTLWWLEFDGSDECLVASFTIPQPVTRINAVRQLAWTSGDVLIAGSANVARLIQTNASPRISIRNNAEFTPVGGHTEATLNTDRVVTEVINGPGNAASLKVDNNTAQSTALSDTTTIGGFCVGANHTGAGTNMRWYGGIIVGNVMDSTNQDGCREYFGDLAGLNL